MRLDPAAEQFITQAQQTKATAQAAEPTRETRLRPHETGRKARQMNVTFPSAAWTEALRQMAEHWGLRPADLLVWCVSYAIRQILDSQVEPPSGAGRKQHHTACEWMKNLPWEPK